jgi:hypothetical protein
VTEWRTAFTAPEAREVITALGAWIYCFRKPVTQTDLSTIKDTMQAITDAIERSCGFSGDQVCLAVAMPQSTTPYLDMSSEEWEDICTDTGFEFVDFEKIGKNEFGEKVGVQRVQESLEACEWESAEGLDFDGDEDGDNEGFGGFAAEEAEMNMELFGMKGALHGFGDEEAGEPSAEEEAKEVEELEVMMRKMIAIKGASQSMLTIHSSRLTPSFRNGRRHGRRRTQTLRRPRRQGPA